MVRVALILFFAFSINDVCAITDQVDSKKERLTWRQKKQLNRLKDDINELYGLTDGNPNINSGPCGRFANLFYKGWNEKFDSDVSISFVMSADSSECYHVLIKLSEGIYFDGGNGVMKKKKLLKGFGDGIYIIDMITYDFELLNKMSYGLDREYKRCPNYSDEKTTEIIHKHLQLFKK